MNPLIVLVLVGVGLALVVRKKVDLQADQKAQDKAQQDANDPSTPTGSLSEAGTEATTAKDRSTQGMIAGVSIGMTVAGPPGALVGALAGLIIGMLMSDQPDPKQWPWWLWAMPYSTFGGWWDDQGSYNLPIPSEDGKAITVLTVPRKWFADNYSPTDGAELSQHMIVLQRSGMLAWRPREQPTPFSMLLYSMAPWLTAYEDMYLVNLKDLVVWTDANGTVHEDGFGWYGKADVFEAQILGMRRVFAAMAVFGADAVKQSFAGHEYNAVDGHSVFALIDLIEWLQHGEDGTPLSPGVKVFMDGSAGAGYPGAWRYTASAATVAPPPKSTAPFFGIAEQSASARLGAALQRQAPVETQRPQLQLQASPAAATSQPSSPTSTTHTTPNANIQVWLPGPQVPADPTTFEARTAPNTWGSSQVVTLSSFVGALGYRTQHDVQEALEGWTLVYGPYTSPQALRVWHQMFPALANQAVEARRVRSWGAL